MSGASEAAPYGRTLPPEQDGHWAEGAAYVAVWEQGRRHVATWVRRAGALLLRWCSLREVRGDAARLTDKKKIVSSHEA